MATEAWKLIWKVCYITGFIFSSCQFVTNNWNKNQQNLNCSTAKETAVCECYRISEILFFEKINMYFRKKIHLQKNFICQKDWIVFTSFWKKVYNTWKNVEFCGSTILRQCFSIYGNFDPQGIYGDNEKHFFVTTRGCYWHLLDRNQRCCSTSYTRQPHNKELCGPQCQERQGWLSLFWKNWFDEFQLKMGFAFIDFPSHDFHQKCSGGRLQAGSGCALRQCYFNNSLTL